MPETPDSTQDRRPHRMPGSLIFLNRWLHSPLYSGLIVAQGERGDFTP